jgi:hypothetical protein
MKRKLKWLAIVPAVSLLGFGTALLLWPRDRITRETWDQIQVGMTEREVEEILGESGVFLDQLTVRVSEFGEGVGKVWDFGRMKNWIGRGGWIHVQFDNRGLVEAKEFWTIRLDDPTFLGRLRDWLGW